MAIGHATTKRKRKEKKSKISCSNSSNEKSSNNSHHSSKVCACQLSLSNIPITFLVVDEDDEEKEVDPSLVGSLDNVYNEETAAAMMKEDPFKRAPVMDKGSATPAEMEKTVDALIVYETEGGSNECLSPRESCSSPDGSLSPVSPRPGEGMELDLLTAGASGEGSSGSSHQQPLSSTVEQLPDIVDISSSANQPLAPAAVRASQLTTNNSPPDIAAQSRDLPPDLGAESRTPLDLLSPEGGGDALLVDLTEGAPSSDQASRQTPT